jgi:hypothetical protein
MHQAIQHVVSELNAYLNMRSESLASDRVVMGNLFDLSGAPNTATTDKLVLSLANIQEDPVYQSMNRFEKRPDGITEQVKPIINLNLYLLIIANITDYDEALKVLEYAISFFQTRNVFDYSTIPALSGQRGRMVFEMNSLTFEQQNHMWGAMGSKYQPSVLYKVGLVAIRDRQLEAEIRPVEQILINE